MRGPARLFEGEAMLTIREAHGIKVYGPANAKTGKRRKIGSIGDALFHPSENRVVGFAIDRPDLAMVVQLKDRYAALDRVAFVDGESGVEAHVEGKAAWDASAARRLGVDWEKTVVWAGMPVQTASGVTLGTVRDAVFDPATGELNALGLTQGMTRDTAIGVRDLPARMVVGFEGEAVVVADDAATIEVDGGAAAAAGRAAAVAKVKVDQAADVAVEKFDDVAVKAGAAAGKAVFAAKVAAKKAAQTDTGKKAMGWLKALKDEVVDAMGDPDDK